jgi:N-acyl-D-aspartate/D-glutamate deacylase
VGIKNGKIEYVGDLSTAESVQRLDVEGNVVSPGFIDIHGHSDVAVLVRPEAENMVMQGITTLVPGNCGFSAVPWSVDAAEDAGAFEDEEILKKLKELGIQWNSFPEYLEQVEKRGTSVNIAPLIGHGSVRAAVIGWDNRPPDASEMESMRAHVADAMQAGVFGISYGLLYAPGFYAQKDEMIEMNKVVARYGGFHSIHIRNEASPEDYMASIREAIEIGEKGGTAIQVSHLETHYPNWGTQGEALQILEDARALGLDVTCDIPPYILSSITLTAVFPSWVLDGGIPRMIERFKNPGMRQKILKSIHDELPFAANFLISGNWDKTWLGKSVMNPQFSGKNISEIAEMRGVDPSFDLVMDILLEEGTEMANHSQLHNEDDIRELVAHPLSMIETDASIEISYDGMTNPRSFGSFPATFRKYVRGEDRVDEPLEKGKKIITLQEAVRKMTSFPAQRLGLRDRGFVCAGMWADLVIFDPETIADQTTYQDPFQYPVGIDYVFLNGEVVVEKGKHTGKLPGKALRHNS